MVAGLITGCGNNANSSESTQASTVAEQTTTQTTAQETTEAATTSAVKKEYLITQEITSKNIADNNVLGDDGKEKIFIYLPPDYYDSEKSYPVVYYLHGYGETPGVFMEATKHDLDQYFSTTEDAFIMVEISGNGTTGGSFYVNSPASGNWEDFVIKDVIPYVDAQYRTLARVESRGICGFSMGGFGSMNLALLHPDIFGAVYSMSPGIMKDDALPDVLRSWTGDSSLMQAYARAFAPDLENTKIYGKIAKLDDSEKDKEIVALWYNGFGNWNQKLEAYLALNTSLRAVAISYGTKDNYPWIPSGSEHLAELLRAEGIEPTVFTFEGGHMMPTNAIADHLGPFFMENLSWD
jgi:enterochelin esterase-like enzyme